MTSDPDAPQPPPANDDERSANSEHTIDLADEAAARRWAGRLGVTIEQLHEAMQAVGPHEHDVTEHLLNQGGSAGAS